MPLGTNHVTNTTGDKFIPELWSDEVVAAYKVNLVAANRISKINHVGKKGDSIHIPKPTRGSASAKAASTEVTLIAATETDVVVAIDQHFEYSRLIEDITATQALDSMRQFYTDDAGYALSKQTDTDILNLAATAQGGTAYSTAVIGGDGTTVWDGSANTNTGNGTTLTDAGLRNAIQILDDEDAPMVMRSLIIPPVEKNTLLGIERFNSRDFVNGNSVSNGMIGDLYGVEVFVTTNAPTIQAVDTTTNYRVSTLLQKDAWVLAEQMKIRSQSQYIQQYLGWLYTADTLYGVKELRTNSVVPLIVPA